MGNRIDLTGQRFGRLVVQREAESKHNEATWLCRCDCGNEVIVTGYKLRHGHTQSCGCLRAENGKTHAIDLTGQRFGRLTVVERSGSIDSFAAWKCRCDCGNEVVVTSSQLRQGLVKSCGCLQRQKGHEQIVKMRSIALRDGTNVNIASEKTKSPFGVRGISRNKSGKKPFEAKLSIRGKVVLRKTFETLDEAIAARKEAEELYIKPLQEKWKIEDERRRKGSRHRKKKRDDRELP